MRKLVVILIACFAVVTFIRAFDDLTGGFTGDPAVDSPGVQSGEFTSLSP